MKKFRWAERLFYGLELKERKYWWLVIGLILALIISQILLTMPDFRKIFVLSDYYEGERVEFVEQE